MKIVSVDKIKIFPEHVTQLEKYGEVTIYTDVPSEEEGLRRIKDADIVIDNWYEMPGRVIAAIPNLKMICVAATGYEWVDLSEARNRKVTVSNSPGYSTEAVAEHTIGLLLRALRKGMEAEQDMKSKMWDPAKYKGKELHGKTLGIIGYGNIGKRVANIAENGFGANVVYVNSNSSKEELEHVLKISDFICINAPLTEKTKNMISANEFNLMKNGVVIVNTGRGAIIDETELVANLKSGKIFAAGFDVFSKEPIKNNNPLLEFANVTVTPHIAYNTEEAELRLSEIVCQNVIGFLEGNPLNVVS